MQSDAAAWLQSRLTTTDHNVLGSLVVLRVATTRQLERLHFTHPAKRPNATSRRTRRSLARLESLGLVESLARQVGGLGGGSHAHIWQLTATGAHFAGPLPRRRKLGASLGHFRHALDVTELVVRLHEQSRAQAVELVSIETEPACWRTYITRQGRNKQLKPDLRVTLGIGDRDLHWFIEVDRDTERRPVLAAKTTAYVAAWRHGAEQARSGTFPRVLWTVPHRQRAQLLTEVCRNSGAPAEMFTVSIWSTAVHTLTTPHGGNQ